MEAIVITLHYVRGLVVGLLLIKYIDGDNKKLGHKEAVLKTIQFSAKFNL